MVGAVDPVVGVVFVTFRDRYNSAAKSVGKLVNVPNFHDTAGMLEEMLVQDGCVLPSQKRWRNWNYQLDPEWNCYTCIVNITFSAFIKFVCVCVCVCVCISILYLPLFYYRYTYTSSTIILL